MTPKSVINQESILKFLKKRAARPVKFSEIADSLRFTKKEYKTLKRILRSLIKSGEIIRTKAGHYGLLEKMNLVTGTFDAHRDGYGFVVSEKSGEQDVFIPPRRTMGAMSGDRIVARIESPFKRDGSIIKILERTQKKIIGELCKERNSYYVKPKSKKVPYYILVIPENIGKAVVGDMVTVEITAFPSTATPPEGKILKILPQIVEPSQEIDLIIEEFSLPNKFPASVLAETRGLKKAGSQFRNRIDCRKLLTVTIDGETAKDFDDAISISRSEGGFILYVHIADVSYYVPWDSALDLEARKRGTSVYFPGSVVPMLPEKLSNNLCSLVPQKDRLTFTVEIHFDQTGQILKKNFYQSIICSDERMTYTSVKNILVDKDKHELSRYARLVYSLEMMEELSGLLRKQRIKRGSLDFDLPEPEVLLDIQGRPEAIIKSERNLAHLIIEDFMISANEAVASYLEESGIPSIYRVHEKPDPAKLDELKPVFRAFGFKMQQSGTRAFHSILMKIKGTSEESFLNVLLLRSLRQAKYFTENIMHFGLASKCYTHFTSPIRRYPDLVIHRILKDAISKNKMTGKKKDHLKKILPDIASNSSKCERTADEAEREIINAMRVWFMKDRVGDEYEGTVTHITSHGLKVQLKDFFVEGFLHVSSMTDDYYRFDEKKYRLTGRRRRKTFGIGQKINIRVDRVNLEEKEIILGLI
jgi:ribonuclease R